MDAAWGVAAIVVSCRNSSCNSSCEAMVDKLCILSAVSFFGNVPNMAQVHSPQQALQPAPLGDVHPVQNVPNSPF